MKTFFTALFLCFSIVLKSNAASPSFNSFDTDFFAVVNSTTIRLNTNNFPPLTYFQQYFLATNQFYLLRGKDVTSNNITAGQGLFWDGVSKFTNGLPGIADGSVTLAKMANMATDSIIGRATASAGAPEVLGALPFAFTGDVTRPIDSNAQTIANDAVTYAKMQNVSAASLLLGRGATTSGDVQEITLGANLGMSGTTLSASGVQNPLAGNVDGNGNNITGLGTLDAATIMLNGNDLATALDAKQDHSTALDAVTDMWVDSMPDLNTTLQQVTAPVVTYFSSYNSSRTITNTTTETSLFPTTVYGSLTTADTFWKATRKVAIFISGVYWTKAANLETVTVRVKVSGVTIATADTAVLPASQAASRFNGMILITCDSTASSSGILRISGGFQYQVTVGGFNLMASAALDNAGETISVDDIVGISGDFAVTADFSAAQVGNSIKTTDSSILILK